MSRHRHGLSYTRSMQAAMRDAPTPRDREVGKLILWGILYGTEARRTWVDRIFMRYTVGGVVVRWHKRRRAHRALDRALRNYYRTGRCP